MRITGFHADQFRNIRSMEFTPREGVNVIYGDNAQGKTNLLEAVWLFSGGKSFRGARESEYVRFGEEVASLSLSFHAQGRDQEASLRFGQHRKNVALNGVKQRRQGDLTGIFCSVVFSPDHLSLVKQGPEKRRRMIDDSLSQAYPKYGRVLAGYEKILKQRNSLLRDIPRHPALEGTLGAWDEGLLEYGSYITAMRGRYVRRLSALSRECYGGISSGREEMGMEYRPGIPLNEPLTDRKEIRVQMEQELRACRREEIRSGITGTGPHRDDVEITLDGRSARSFGSQGQQRSCILAIKLAECGILEERNGEPPVVMLDDVMSELDEHRRSYLLNRLSGRQVLITCCDAGDFGGLEDGAVFHIHGGRLLDG